MLLTLLRIVFEDEHQELQILEGDVLVDAMLLGKVAEGLRSRHKQEVIELEMVGKSWREQLIFRN